MDREKEKYREREPIKPSLVRGASSMPVELCLVSDPGCHSSFVSLQCTSAPLQRQIYSLDFHPQIDTAVAKPTHLLNGIISHNINVFWGMPGVQ